MSDKECHDGVAPLHLRRSKLVKNLQEEVDLILLQEESDDKILIPVPVEETKAAPQNKKLNTPLMVKTRSSAYRKGRKTVEVDFEKSNNGDGDASTNEAAPKSPCKENKDEVNELPKTPIDRKAAMLPTTPITSRILMTETPRRSARKSIRPPLDYDDIIEKKMLRSAAKETNDKDNEELEQDEPPQQKWTKALVGGVSQSRGRKSKRSAVAKKRAIEQEIPEEKEIISKKRNKSTNSDDMSNVKKEEAASLTQQKEEALNEESSQRIIKKRMNKSTTNIDEHLSNDNEESSQKIIKKSNKSAISQHFSNVEEKQEVLNEEPKQKIIKKRKTKSTNKKDLCNDKEKEPVIRTPQEEFSQEFIEKGNTESITNCDEEKEIEKPSKGEVEQKGESHAETSLIEEICKEVLLQEQLLIEETVEESSSIQKESSELILEGDDIQMIEMKANNVEDNLEAVKDIIDLNTLDETHTKGVEVPSSSSSNVADEEVVGENFGTYLKSNIIDLSDLGLEAIPIDEPSSNAMHPLLITDDADDDNDDVGGDVAAVKKNELNVTFEAEDSHVFDIDKPTESESKQLEVELEMDNDNIIMQTLQISDDELEEVLPVKKSLTVSFNDTKSMIKVVLTDPDDHNSTILKCETTQQPSTPTSSLSRNKSYRLPTPYKQRETTPYKQKLPTPYKQKDLTPYKQRVPTPYKQNKENLNIFKIKMTPRSMNLMNNLTTLEPKDIVLRSIRKRSKSVSINPEPNSKGVTFYSPANQTLNIEELDELMAQNVKKQQINDSYVTKRRKRSISLDDVRIQAHKSRIPKLLPPVNKFKSNTPNKIRPGSAQKAAAPVVSKPTTRTKMPNFAAIHQKTFNQMENLVEHVERKAERAKILTSSASKFRTASIQKLQRSPKRLVGGSVPTPLKKDKPKASKQINMMSVFENIAKSEQNPFAITKILQDEQQQVILSNLPKPRPMNNNEMKFNQTRSVTTTMTTTSSKLIKKKTTTTTTTVMSNSQTLKESNTRGGALAMPCSTTTKFPKAQPPPFNLSTQASTSKSSTYESKMAERRQRHMGMFKGRTGAAKRAIGTESSNVEIIRGVRSNRRFELQMQHRKNVDQ